MMPKKSSLKPGKNTAKHALGIAPKPVWFHQETRDKKYENPCNPEYERFDSELEFGFWWNLRVHYGDKLLIERQFPVIYKPETPIYPALTWKVDLHVRSSSQPDKFILFEVKGRWLEGNSFAKSEFQHKYQFLQFVDPSLWDRLFVVSDTRWSFMDGAYTVDFHQAHILLNAHLFPLK